MSRPRPDPGAARKPPSRLVFEDDGPWLQFGSGLELSDLDRSHQLGCRLWTPQTNDIVNDKQLEQRYKEAGIEHLYCSVGGCRPGRAAAEPDHSLRRPGFRHGIVPRRHRKAARG
jgi:hypothetical protein